MTYVFMQYIVGVNCVPVPKQPIIRYTFSNCLRVPSKARRGYVVAYSMDYDFRCREIILSTRTKNQKRI